MKSIKYDHEPRSLRMPAAGMRFLGSGHPPLHRFRLGLEFAISGHREAAYEMGGVEAAKRLARERRGEQFDPMLSELVSDEAEVILSGLDSVATWDAVIGAEPALAVMLSGDRFDAALLAIGNFVDLKRRLPDVGTSQVRIELRLMPHVQGARSPVATPPR